ncbi:Glutaredoxin-like domain [Nitrosomonas sp. PY1]|uniref:glutaredoxin family protein n=1 Tax=Nitrosomonas sp. PY1 TaxID=1803906 RepID=UPI001FC81A55|nr:glutaredoxin family protein [Nitrosomonas sp. PY1]GKS69637.1 Glutaredoxin-like domain [Nitrosomonas sp. PY1]
MTTLRSNDSSLKGIEQPSRFIVYIREDCHLCQQMILALTNLPEQVSLDFQVIDIDSDPELIAMYGEKIPVLVSPNHQVICYHFLDVSALDDYLGKIR